MFKNYYGVSYDNDTNKTISFGGDSTKTTNLDYDFNTEYGDGDIPEIDKPKPSDATNVFPDEVPARNNHTGK